MRTVLFTQNTFSLVFSHINKGLVNLRHKDGVGVRKVFYCFTYLRFSLDTCACRDITSSMYFSLPVLQCTYWSVTPMIPNHSKSLESLDIFHAKSYINNADCRKIKQKSVLGSHTCRKICFIPVQAHIIQTRQIWPFVNTMYAIVKH